MNLDELRIKFREMKYDKYFTITSRLMLVLIPLTLVFLIWSWPRLPQQVPLFYSLPWGEEQLAPTLSLYILILGSGAMYALNIVLAVWVYNRWSFYSRMLLIGSSTATILAIITVIKIVFLIS